MNEYIISDTHFSHANIIKYCHRPYRDVYDMNESLIDNWNNIVTSEDVVYHLGDLFLGRKEELYGIISRLNGNIYLIRGNHDKLPVSMYEDCGLIVLKKPPISLDKHQIMLSHYPLPNKMIKDNYINVHGHIHHNELFSEYDRNKHINVSCEVIDYKPVLIKKLCRKK